MSRILVSLALALTASAAPAQTIATGDPAAMAKGLSAMGYKPGPIDPNGGAPILKVSVSDFETALAFGGCTDGKACKYLVLVSRFTDIKSPPSDWVNARNAELDLGKAWVSEDGILSFSLPVPSGGEPVTAPMLRFIIEQWQGVVGSLSQSAMAAKLVK